MDDLAHTAQRVKFGLFEVDLRAGELWKAGRKRKLTGQPFAILAILLERPGEVVSREEFQKRLWPDTFVDVDHNLNTAINKIREALDDSSERPRFIETLPRRGYRFIAPVAPVESAQPPTPPIPAPPASDIGPAQTPVAPSPRKKFPAWLWVVVAAVILVLAYLLRPALPPPQVTGITQLTQDGATKLFFVGATPPPLLTDGSRLYFDEGGLVSPIVAMQVSNEGGATAPVGLPPTFLGIDDIAPNRPELLINGPPRSAHSDGLWRMSIPGGQPRRVGDLMTSGGDAFAPNGKAILYAFQHDVYTANLDGSQSRKLLTVNAGIPFMLHPSPDGRLLLFNVWNTTLSTSSLWEANADGSHPHRLLAGWQTPANECCAKWTSDGKYFVFQATHEGMTNLWAVRVKGDFWRKVSHDPVRLTLGQMNSESPLPSKDGSKVFFIGSTRRDELIRYDEKTKAFTPWLSGLSAEGVTYTPDGKKIAYVSYPEGILWTSNADGTDRHELSFPPTEVGLPTWSPDGTRIEFSARQPAGFWQIFTVSTEGGDPQQLTSGASDHTDGSWSPDGNSMAFGGSVEQARQSTKANIHILDLKTRQVTDVPDSAHLFSPRWSPDGRHLLAVTGDYQKLVLYNFAQHKWRDLLKMRADYPHWTNDSKCIYFNRGTNAKMAEYRICLDDRTPRHIVDLSQGGTLVEGRFGPWSGLGPDDSILATRDIGTQEIYALNIKFPN